MNNILSLLVLLHALTTACQQSSETPIMAISGAGDQDGVLKKISDIPPPAGFQKVSVDQQSFGHWLRNIPLKTDKTVYLFNGNKKPNQQAQFAVLDIPVGKKDLQQCADACMRLRAEYLLAQGRTAEIVFFDNNKTAYRPQQDLTRPQFEQYMEKVFSWCGTISLQKQLKKISDPGRIDAGDIFIVGGSPGHAVTVMDVAVDRNGKQLFLLSQSYMPAQDIHILVNPGNPELSPWYELHPSGTLITPEWRFRYEDRRRW